MNTREDRRPAAVRALILLQILLGVSAIIPGSIFVMVPDGSWMGMPVSMLQYSPFRDFLVPGIILVTFLGIYPLIVAYGLRRRPAWRWADSLNPFKGIHWSWAGSLASGVIAIIWIVVEVIMLRSVAFLHILYFFWGVALVFLSLVPPVRRFYERART